MTVHRSESVSIKEEVAVAAAKSAIPISVSGGLLFGMHIGLAIQWATLIFLILQIAFLVRKHLAFLVDIWRGRRNKRREGIK